MCVSVWPSAAWGQGTLEYPKTAHVDHVDDYHGTQVPDPYRWLEDDVRTSKQVADWVDGREQGHVRVSGGDSAARTASRAADRTVGLRKVRAPFKPGGRYYYFHNTGLQNQSVLFTMDSLKSEPRVLIDPNTWSQDGTVALAGLAFSDDGKYSPTAFRTPAATGRPGRSWRSIRARSWTTN